ncbi:MAG: 30S ribosomal protein S2 [Rhodomicrobiaceae bacterium]
MALPQFTMRQLLEAGVHFGHQSHRWNPKMDRFIFGTRNKIHIIDLAQTVPLLHQALVTVSDVVARGGRVLYVGTKRQAAEAVAESAKRSAQYFVNHRWLGGMLTNWKTITNSIRRLRQLDELLGAGAQGLTKKELLNLTRERDKLELALGGIRDMGGLPDLMFIIDTNKESIAVAEAKKLGIPVVAVVDSNCDPDNIDHLIPGNDDAGRAITLYCDLIARAALDGIERSATKSGIDIGAMAEPVVEDLGSDDVPGSGSGEAGQLSGFTPLSAPDGEPDDLTKLKGVGKSWAGKLNEYGIYHFNQIAALTPENLEELDESLNAKGKIAKSGWIEEAKKLMEETASAPAPEAAAAETA